MKAGKIVAVAILQALAWGGFVRGQEIFIRGDVNGDKRVTVSDAAFIIGQLMAGARQWPCAKAADSTDGGTVDIGDVLYIIRWTSGIGPQPPPPYPDPGPDTTPDALSCGGTDAVERVPDPAYGMTWKFPETVQREQQDVELLLQARTGAPIQGFSISCNVNFMAAEVAGVDFVKTVVPAASAADPVFAGFFHWNSSSIVNPEAGLFTAAALFVGKDPLGWMDIPATTRPLSREPLLRVLVNIKKDAPLIFGKTKILWPTGDVDPGAIEFSVQGMAHIPAERGDADPFIIDGEEFMRGDSNADRLFDISDAIYDIDCLFLGGPLPSCLKAADMNDDSTLDVSDVGYGIRALFLGGPKPPDPSPPGDCFKDPKPDDLTCLISNCK